MSSVKFFPIKWELDTRWTSVKINGYTDKSKSIFMRVYFSPYFTIQYNPNVDIQELHEYITDQTPIEKMEQINENIYRIYTKDKENYNAAINFYVSNNLGLILDKDQHPLSKFFSFAKINPGSWQEAHHLQSLRANVTSAKKYAKTDLQYYSSHIESINLDLDYPKTVNAFWDIEAISEDDVSFPDAEQEPDNIFAISLVVDYRGEFVENIVYFLTDQELDENYENSVGLQAKIVTLKTEKELIYRFFEDLGKINPDRLIGYNSRRFDFNYIGARAMILGVPIPKFTKYSSMAPSFYKKFHSQIRPFPSYEEIWAMDMNGISQIDMLDLFRVLYPTFGTHRLDFVSNRILGKGKTGLEIADMFRYYRRNLPEELKVIIDYSITDSYRLYELWEAADLSKNLYRLSNLWKADAEHLNEVPTERLFDDYIKYMYSPPPQKLYRAKSIGVERTAGIYRDVYLYSMSDIYLKTISNLGFSDIASHFEETNDGVVLFKSGYFNVNGDELSALVKSQVPELVWIDDLTIATTKQNNNLNFLAKLNLVIVSDKSWIQVDDTGAISKHGFNEMVRPPFNLAQRYIDYIINKLITQKEKFNLPTLDSNFDDFVLTTKISSKDFIDKPAKKQQIIEQLNMVGHKITRTWQKINYINTKEGPIIEDIYSKDLPKYVALLDMDWYDKKLHNILKKIS